MVNINVKTSGTGVPSSGSLFYKKKGTQVQHAIPGTARPHSGLKNIKISKF